jgi:hypothetical protein
VKLRHWLLAIFVPLAALALWRHGTTLSAGSSTHRVHDQPLAGNASAYLGAGSCSASACHNQQNSHGTLGSEFTLWATRDPHAKAYESLFHEKSLSIQKALHSSISPHEDARCLKCHVSPHDDAPQPAHFKTDGVSCETCHGPAKQWIDLHHLDAWQRRTAAEKQLFGMRDMRSVVSRVKTCMPCHVGSSDIDINHDLIAAGHPRLFFEFSAFHARMPHHWPDEKDRRIPNFEACAWLVGQLLTAHASLELLADRAGAAKKDWPQYAENDCATCHHDLQSNRAKSLRKPGSLSFGHAAAFSPNALAAFRGQQDRERAAEFEKTLQRLHANLHQSTDADRAALAKDAKRAAALLHPFVDQAVSQHSELLSMNELFQSLLDAAPTNSDEAVQRMLGLAALQRSFHEPLQPNERRVLNATAEKMDRPRGFDPFAIQQRWLDFKRLNARKGP